MVRMSVGLGSQDIRHETLTCCSRDPEGHRRYSGTMERSIVAFHADEVGDWVAELSCGHDQHVRHRPPFQDRHWVVDKVSRDGRIGMPLDCPLCERTEPPDALRFVRSSPEWDERTVPAGLLRSHQVPEGMWGRITVTEGHLRFSAATHPRYEVVLGPSAVQAIPPGVEHQVEPLGSGRFSIDFFTVDRGTSTSIAPTVETLFPPEKSDLEEGDDPACWAHRVCPECGAFLDGASHRYEED